MFKKLTTLIKKHAGKIMLIAGIGLFMFNVFNFGYQTSAGYCFNFDCENIQGVAYYYTSTQILSIAIGAMLIASGALIIKNKKTNNQNK